MHPAYLPGLSPDRPALPEDVPSPELELVPPDWASAAVDNAAMVTAPMMVMSDLRMAFLLG